MFTLVGLVAAAIVGYWLLTVLSKLPAFGKGKDYQPKSPSPVALNNSVTSAEDDSAQSNSEKVQHEPLPSRPPPRKKPFPVGFWIFFIALNGAAYFTKDKWAPLFFPTTEERLVSMCIQGLEQNLERWARFDGWSVKKAEGVLLERKPNDEMNEHYNSNLHWQYEVMISEFTVKNAFGADLRSLSVCSGNVVGTEDSFSLPSSTSGMRFTLNGARLGF